MADCYAKECPHGEQCVSIAPNYYLYDCKNPPTPPTTNLKPSGDYASSSGGDVEILQYVPSKSPPATGGNPLIDFFVNLFNDIKDTISGLFGSNESAVQPRGIMENRALLDELVSGGGSSITGTLDPYATISESVNKRGGEQKSSAPKVYNIFGHELSIPQGMMIPLGIAIVILVIVLLKR